MSWFGWSTFRLLTIAALVMCVGLLDNPQASAGTIVVIQLVNGRLLTGEVNSRTDKSDLWLHSAEPSIVVLSSVPWSDVAAARIGQQTLSTVGLREALTQLKSPIPVAIFRQSTTPEAQVPAHVQRVSSFEILAKLGNWDRDVEPDGLEVRVNPMTADGNTAAVDGMIKLRLVGRRVASFERLESQSAFGFRTDSGSPREYAPRMNNARYIELGQWNERIRSRDATSSGYLLRLPFRTVHPEYDLDIALDGQLDAHLSVQGQPILEATAPLQLRTFSPLREELQLNRRTRFFPDEFTGR